MSDIVRRDAQRVETKRTGFGLLSKGIERISVAEKLNETTLYWSPYLIQESPMLENIQVGHYLPSDWFTLHRSNDKYEQERLGDPTNWRFRLYPIGAAGAGRGACLYVENMNSRYFDMRFSVQLMKFNADDYGRALPEFRVDFQRRKVLSHDGKAIGVNLGSFKRMMESLKARKHQPGDVITFSFKIDVKLMIPAF